MTVRIAASATTSTGVSLPMSSSETDTEEAPEVVWPTLGTVPDVLGSPWLCETQSDPVTPEPWVEPLPDEETDADA